jgi:two-component system nitrate/nitrite sensor histidine kinase NarX
VLEERSRLAAEVHDGLAQSLGFLNVKVQQVQRLMARGQVAEASVALQELRDGSQELYAEVRGMIQGLRWARGDHGGLAQQLRQYGLEFAARTGLDVTADVGAEPDLPPEAQLQLFRIVQEALNNVHQHARARHVTVRLSNAPDGISLAVEDDGTGLRPPDREGGDHFGLRIMRERAQSIGGELKVESRPGAGTALHIRVPARTASRRREEKLWSASAS